MTIASASAASIKTHIHEALDRAILERVSNGDHCVVEMGEDALGVLLKAHEAQGREYGPLLERRLSVLRKAGKLAYSRKTGWQVSQESSEKTT